MRAAAIQMEAVVGDLAANLEQAERLATEAAEAGAEWVALPEFFTTGIGFVPELADTALAPDGEATELMTALARRHGIGVSGSFMCRDADGEVRNAVLVVTPEGVAGRHDKDLPTMWENAFYVGGEEGDDGIIDLAGMTVGTAVCWELMRTQTVRRLAGRIDLAVGGSGWWSIPPLPPAALSRRLEARNAATAWAAVESFSRFVGAPFIHGAHAGRLACPMPWSPLPYRGYFQGGAAIVDADGTVLARRSRRQGMGVVLAEVAPGRREPSLRPPQRFWLHRREPMSVAAWSYQRIHGRRWYRRNVRGRPPATVPERAPAAV
jgi:predicted amidohydrolase